jgi:transposase-like protein
MDARMQLVAEYLKGERPMTTLCVEFSVSRKTAYKWVTRYESDGPRGARAPFPYHRTSTTNASTR